MPRTAEKGEKERSGFDNIAELCASRLLKPPSESLCSFSCVNNTSHYSKQIEASSEHSKLKHTWMHVYVQPSVSINVRQTGEVKLLLGKAVVLPKPK